MYNTLMEKAQTMSPEEFKVYLREHMDGVEEKYRKVGGGVLGGQWIFRDPTGKFSTKMVLGCIEQREQY